MKTILRTLLFYMGFLICIYPSFGQGKFALSASVTPYYQHTNSKTNIFLPDLSGGTPIAVDETYRQNGQGYAVGLMARYALTAYWSISSGILCNYTTYKTPTITTRPDYTMVNIPQFITGKSHKHNYQIPLLVNYQSSTKRLSPYLSAGALFSFRGTSFIDVGTGVETPVVFGKALGISPVVGIGGIYQLNNHLSLIAQPSFTYIMPPGNATVIFNKNYLFGLQAQLLYKL